MKKLTIPMFLLLLVIACTTPKPKEEMMAKPVNEGEEQTKIVYAYIDGLLNKNFEVMDTLLAEKFMDYGPSIMDSLSKSQLIDVWKKRWSDEFNTVNYDRITTVFKHIDSGNYAGDWVSDWANITLNYKDGKMVRFSLNDVYKVVDGKIAMSASYYDASGILKQLGWEFVPPKVVVKKK